jgi:hypothetical protein
MRNFLSYAGLRKAVAIATIAIATLDATTTLAQKPTTIVRPPPGKPTVPPPGTPTVRPRPFGKTPAQVPRPPAPEVKEFNDLEASRHQDPATQQRVLREATESTTKEVSSVFEEAESTILRKLSARRTAPTEEQIRNIIKREIDKEISKAAKRSAGSPVEIKVLEGKAKIDASFFIGGVKITGGEVDFRKLLLGLGASVLACKATFGKDTDYSDCLKAVFHQFLAALPEEVAPKMKNEFDDKQRSSSEPRP